jgi:hypothetical protein
MNKKLMKESVQDILNNMGYYQNNDGKWEHEKTGKVLSDKHAQDIAAERAARKSKAKKETTAAGSNPTDKDARKPGEESTRSEEVEYDGEELEESGRFTPSSPFTNRNQSRSSLSRGYKARGMEGGLPGPDKSPHGRARMRAADLKGKMDIIQARGRAMDKMFAGEFGTSGNKQESFDLFPKSDERLLREHIRAEYEARGIYPTAREVQETYNKVMSLLEKVSAEEKARREALRYGGTNKRKARREARTGRPDDSGNVPQFFKDEGERQAAHSAARGKRKVSPSSPARQQSDVEIRTRKSGIKSTDVINMMNKLRETNR